MKKILGIFFLDHIWDEDKLVVNKYFTIAVYIIAALLGALSGGSRALNSFFHIHVYLTGAYAAKFVIIFWIIMILESIIGASNVKIAIIRSLYTVLVSAICFALGYILSIAVIVILVIIAAVTITAFALRASLSNGLGGSSSGNSGSSGEEQKYFHDESGRRVDLEDAGAGDYYGSDGNKYESTFGGGVRRKE